MNELTERAVAVATAITDTDKKQMQFTYKEVQKVHEALWYYEHALQNYALEHSQEEALRFHYALDEKTQQQVQRACVMLGRPIEKSIEVSNVKH